MNDLLISAILIISIATMSAAMAMMFAAIQTSNLRQGESDSTANKGDRNRFPGRRQGSGGGDNGGSPPAQFGEPEDA